jgi:hypothetical protein
MIMEMSITNQLLAGISLAGKPLSNISRYFIGWQTFIK